MTRELKNIEPYEMSLVAEEPDPDTGVHPVKVQRCSACGSGAPHHVQYVLEHGVCVS